MLLLGASLPDSSSGAMSKMGVLEVGVAGVECDSGMLGISTHSSSESDKDSSDELLPISRTSTGSLVGFGTSIKNPLIFPDPTAAFRNLAWVLYTFAQLVPL